MVEFVYMFDLIGRRGRIRTDDPLLPKYCGARMTEMRDVPKCPESSSNITWTIHQICDSLGVFAFDVKVGFLKLFD